MFLKMKIMRMLWKECMHNAVLTHKNILNSVRLKPKRDLHTGLLKGYMEHKLLNMRLMIGSEELLTEKRQGSLKIWCLCQMK